MLQLDLLLLLEACGELAGVKQPDTRKAQEAEPDQGVNPSADRHSESAQHRNGHV
jgi:hypothetical protein